MVQLTPDRAPAAALPRRFLLSAPLWGVAAGGLLMLDGDAALVSRWSPATLALVHAFTLGVLGNALFGSLLQFLPAAAGVRVSGGERAGFAMHALLNLGAVLLVAGFRAMRPELLLTAGMLLAVAFALLAAMTLPGLLRARGQSLLRFGLVIGVGAGATTATLGVLMLLGLTGRGGLPLLPWIDIHAGWGLLGWMLVPLASVARVVMPMFQGTAVPDARVHAAWLALTLTVLGVGTLSLHEGEDAVLRWGAAICAVAFALGALWRQWHAKRSRNRVLVHAWRAGLVALLAAATALVVGRTMLAGLLAIAVGLPLLVAAMLQEIAAFLAWIELHCCRGRGMRVPAVQRLMPEEDKARVLAMQLFAAVALIAAVCWPQSWAARVAGVALIVAHGALWLTLLGVGRRRDQFLRAQGLLPNDMQSMRSIALRSATAKEITK